MIQHIITLPSCAKLSISALCTLGTLLPGTVQLLLGSALCNNCAIYISLLVLLICFNHDVLYTHSALMSTLRLSLKNITV